MNPTAQGRPGEAPTNACPYYGHPVEVTVRTRWPLLYPIRAVPDRRLLGNWHAVPKRGSGK